MLTILGVSITYEALAAFVAFLLSEYIGTNPNLKSNSVLQYLAAAIRGVGTIRKEDDQIQDIKRILKGGNDDN
jgi:hypothetical protein